MTVSSQTNNVMFVGNGVATSFPLPFRFFSNGDIRAYFIDSTTGASTPMALGTDYTLIGAGEPEVDGNALSLLTTTVPLASLRGLYIERVMSPVQETDIVNQGEFFAATHEDVFDRLTMLIQQAESNSKGAIRVAIGDPEPARLPPAGSRALYMMGFDNLGNPIAVVPETGSAAGLAMDLLNDTDPAKGASLVGFIHTLPNSIGRTVRDAISDYVSILNWIDPAEHAAIRDRTSTFDCGPAIRTAVAAVPEGTAIYFPYGLYIAGKALVGDTEVVSINKAGVTFFGEGTIRRKENNTGYFIRIAANDVTLRGLEIDGNRGAAGIPDSPGFGSTIRSVGFVRGSIVDCRIINSAGQAIGAGAGCNYWRVEGNYFDNFYSTAIQFAAEKTDVTGLNFNMIIGNHVKGDLPASARFCNGIFLTTSATTETHDTHFCDFNIIANNIIEDVPDTGIESGYKCRYTLIEGNTVRRSFNAEILVRDNRHSVVNANIISKRTGHASSFRHGIYVDGLSITGDAAPITNAYCVISNNSIQGAEQSGISLIAAERSVVSGNMILGVATNNGSTGINIKSGYSNVFGNTCQDFQFLYRFSLESQRALSNQIILSRCVDNIGINGADGIMLDATTAMALNDCEVCDNKFTNLSSGTISQSGTPTFFNTTFYNNIDRSNPQRGMPSQATATAVIQSPGGIQRLNAGAQFGTVTAFDRYVAGIVSIKMGNETALFKTDGTGAITAISESTNIGVVGSGKLYRLEALTGAFVVKRYDAGTTHASFIASLV